MTSSRKPSGPSSAAFAFPPGPVIPPSHINAAPLTPPSLTCNHQEDRGKSVLFPSSLRAPLPAPHNFCFHNFSYYLTPQPLVTHLLPSTECAIPASWLFLGPGGQFHLGEGGRVSSRWPGCPPHPPHLPPQTVNIWGSPAIVWLREWTWPVHRAGPRGGCPAL